MNSPRRRGFSLLEILLATSILIGSTIVLTELVSIGSRHASAARDLAKSQLICQSKLNEILANIAPAEPVRPTPYEDDPEWVYWVEVQPLKHPDLVALEVYAAREVTPRKQTARFSLMRWVRDPRAQRQRPSDSAQPPEGMQTVEASPGVLP